MSDWKRDALNVLCERYGLILADHTFMDDRLEAGLSHVLRRAYAERADLSLMISQAEAALREISPGYPAIMDEIESEDAS